MNIIKTSILTLFLSIIISGLMYSQTLKIENIIPDNYPEIKAEYRLTNTSGDEVRTFSDADLNAIKVIDGGKERKIKKLYCPPAEKSKFSAIITIDISLSMDSTLKYDGGIPVGPTRMQIAKNSAKKFIEKLPDGRFECALTSFDRMADLNQDFTTNKQALLDSLAKLKPRGGTDYNAAFLQDFQGKPGCLEISRKAKYKRIIIFLTDGNHDKNFGPVKINEILNLAKELDATVFCLTLGMPMPTELTTIAEQTGGNTYPNPASEEEVTNIYMDILAKAKEIGTPSPCEAYWDTDCDGGSGKFEVLNPIAISSDISYSIPKNLKPYIDVQSRYPYFENVSTSKDINVTLTAKNNQLKITGYYPTDRNFKITSWGGSAPPFDLTKDGPGRTITITYTSPDRNFHLDSLFFTGTACDSFWVIPSAGWIYANDANCGSSLKDKPVTKKFVMFCNHSGAPLWIDEFRLTGGNKSEFKINNSPAPFVLPPDSCIELEITFNPADIGERSTIFEAVSGTKVWSSKVWGNGSGEAEIESVRGVNFQNTNCSIPYRDTTIAIKNIGALDLVIQSIAITLGNFDFKIPIPPSPLTIPPGEKMDLTIRFEPSSSGTKTGNIEIQSNASNNPINISLNGTKDSIGFTTNYNELDFGTICPNEAKELKLLLTSSGSARFTILGTSSTHTTLDQTNLSINPSESKEVLVSFLSATEGNFEETLIFKDEFSCYEKRVRVLAKVVMPRIQSGIVVNLVSTIGSSKDTVIILHNESDVDIKINSINIGDAQFTTEPISFPFTIPARGTKTLRIIYRPTKDQIVNTNLILKGGPCDFEASIQLIGNPSLAIAEIYANNHEGLVFEEIQVPIGIRNTLKLKESGATSIQTTIRIPSGMVESIPPTPSGIDNAGFYEIFLDLPIKEEGDQILTTLNLRILRCSTDIVPIAFFGSKSVGGELQIRETNGTLNAKCSSGNIRIGNAEATPGQVFEIPFYLENPVNITPFHRAINIQIKYNYTLFEPVNMQNITDKGIDAEGKRILEIKFTSLNNLSNPTLLGNVQFRGMLGNRTNTIIETEKISVDNGLANISSTQGNFNLLGVCNEGSPRLFNPRGQATLNFPKPNPSFGKIELNFTTVESGTTKIWISNLLGNEVLEIINNTLEPGTYNMSVELGNLESGTYFILMRTTSQFFSKRLEIIK